MNIQEKLPVMEMFYSIQGEGNYTGRPAFFVRLGGCDVGCPWCDVKESWEASDHERYSVEQIVGQVEEAGANFVVVTGGEPMMYKLDALTQALKSKDVFLALETSGVYPISGSWDWICFSPKKFKAPLEGIYKRASELKVIVFNKHDLAWAEEHAKQLNNTCKLYMQAEWSRRDTNTPMILNYIREHPNWNISLQTHKYIGVP